MVLRGIGKQFYLMYILLGSTWKTFLNRIHTITQNKPSHIQKY